MQSPRAQADRALYRAEMRKMLECTPNLHLRQGMVVDLLVKSEKVCGVAMQDGRQIQAAAVVIAAGTFLNGLIHTGRRTYTAGRVGEPASIELAETLKRLGFPVGSLKPDAPRLNDAHQWIAFRSGCDDRPVAFSFLPTYRAAAVKCYIGYTKRAPRNLRRNLHESPLYRTD